jgi:DNA polymerase III epsilon subunit-like protein
MAADELKAPAPLVFLDTETTGVHPGRRVWEVGMIRRTAADITEDELQFFLEVDLAKADPFGLKVGGFYERHPWGQFLAGVQSEHGVDRTRWMDFGSEDISGRLVTVRQASKLVAAWTHGAHIVGAVPNFDSEVLGKMLRYEGLVPGWHYHLVDIENLAVGYLAGRGTVMQPPWSSDELTAALEVEPATEQERHTALGDARWAMRIYDKVMGVQ